MLIEKLRNNKGVTSLKLGKELAEEVLTGNDTILSEAVKLVCYDLYNEKEKNIRAGAAKILEKVSEKKPEKVSLFLSDLLEAFQVHEPQTRWMLMMTFGYCAKLNTPIAIKAIDYAHSFITENNGVCLSGAAELFLGRVGALSEELVKKVLPILFEAYDVAQINEIDWIFEAFIMLVPNLSDEEKKQVFQCAADYNHASKKSTLKRREKLMKLAQID
jgi:hypothetical protein